MIKKLCIFLMLVGIASADYLGKWKIDDYVPITASTHRFSSGAAYAPSAITYSIYEDATTTGLDEDVDMVPASPFDSVVGLYYARRQLTTAAGFEAGKNYIVLIKATVDSVAGIATHTFQIEPDNIAANTTQLAGVTQSLTDLKDFADAGYTPGTNSVLLVDLATTVTTLTGHTAQTGDSYARIGAAGAGLTSVAWNASWDTEVQSEVADALAAFWTSPATLVDLIWDELTSGHTDSGSTGAALTVAGGGDGTVVVDDDYKSGDYKYETSGGVGIDNAVIYAYLKADYDAGNTGISYIKAQTTTTTDGSWSSELNLDPETYTLYYFKQGYYGPDTQEITVTD